MWVFFVVTYKNRWRRFNFSQFFMQKYFFKHRQISFSNEFRNIKFYINQIFEIFQFIWFHGFHYTLIFHFEVFRDISRYSRHRVGLNYSIVLYRVHLFQVDFRNIHLSLRTFSNRLRNDNDISRVILTSEIETKNLTNVDDDIYIFTNEGEYKHSSAS